MEHNKQPLSLEECIAASGGTRSFFTGDGVYSEIPRILREDFDTEKAFLVADENTMQAAGNDIERLLVSAGIPIGGKYIFKEQGRLYADYSHVALIKDRITAAGLPVVPVSVGAGTINDLVKQAAGELALPYLCVPTAASVDGFTSFGAAILKNGCKQTLPCAAPRCIVADTRVLANAPPWLSSSGFADLAGKITAAAFHVSAAPLPAIWARRPVSAGRSPWGERLSMLIT